MIKVIPLRGRLLASLICALLLLSWALPAQAQLMRQLTFKELVNGSDHIFTATCVNKKVFTRNGGIVTHYELKPSEFLKGQLNLTSQGTVEMEERGGNLTGPVPLGQFVPGMANLAPNEEVMLFTSMAQAPAGSSPQANSSSVLDPALPRIVGRWQGRFTIFRHPETGVKLVARPNLNTLPTSTVSPKIQQMMIAQNQKFASPTAGPASMVPLAQSNKKSLTHKAIQSSKQIAKRIDKEVAGAQSRRAGLAVRSKAAADEIYQYEQLDAIKTRIKKIVDSAKK